MPGGVEEGEAIYVGRRPDGDTGRVVEWANQEIANADKAPRWVVHIGNVVFDPDPAGLEHWEDPGDPWDVLVINGKPMPGIWEIESCERRHKLDKKKSPKKDGANVEDLGRLTTKVTARGQLYCKPAALRGPGDADHWGELQKRLEEINPRVNGKLRAPLTIYHPAIAITGITTVYLECVRSPRIRDGIMEISLEFQEYTAPKATKSSKTARTDPKNPIDEQFLANMKATPADQLFGYGVAHRSGPGPGGTGDFEYTGTDAGKPVDWMDEQEKRTLVSRPSGSNVQPSEFRSGNIRDAF